jgi:hypothetical protein
VRPDERVEDERDGLLRELELRDELLLLEDGLLRDELELLLDELRELDDLLEEELYLGAALVATKAVIASKATRMNTLMLWRLFGEKFGLKI